MCTVHILAAGPVQTNWVTNIYGAERFVADAETPLVPESSGVIASRLQADLYWTHNDSGMSHPRVYAFRLSAADRKRRLAKHLGYVELEGASCVDWEDIAAGPDGTIYILDGGDNPPCCRSNKRIYRFKEPAVDSNGPPVALHVRCESCFFEYPDARDAARPAMQNNDRYDAECLIVHPMTGDIYIVTKRDSRQKPIARVFKLAAVDIAWNTNRGHILKFVADISDRVPHMITAGDIDVAGERVLIRNYFGFYEFILPKGQRFETIFQQQPVMQFLTLEAVQLLQGEGICYARDGRDLVITTEARRGVSDRRFKVFTVPWRLANLRANHVADTSADVSWNTADPLDSLVEYGLTDRFGFSVGDDKKTTTHHVALTNLKPDTRYHYRVRSGPLTYPTTGPAPSFVTRQSNASQPLR